MKSYNKSGFCHRHAIILTCHKLYLFSKPPLTYQPCCWQTWEQEFAWTEADKPLKLAAKALAVPHDSKLSQAPIFCFETMMHMLYWTCLVYDYKRVCSSMPHNIAQQSRSMVRTILLEQPFATWCRATTPICLCHIHTYNSLSS